MGNGSPLAGTTTTELELVYSPSFKETARTVFGKEICVDGTNLCFADLDGTLAIILSAFPTISSVEDLEDQLSAALSGAVGVAVDPGGLAAGIASADPAELEVIGDALPSIFENMTPATLRAFAVAVFAPGSDLFTVDATGQVSANLGNINTPGHTNI